jgi:hypothetical protein
VGPVPEIDKRSDADLAPFQELGPGLLTIGYVFNCQGLETGT